MDGGEVVNVMLWRSVVSFFLGVTLRRFGGTDLLTLILVWALVLATCEYIVALVKDR